MKDRTRERVALGLGLLAGAAVGLFLNSDKGRKVRQDAGEKVGEISEKPVMSSTTSVKKPG